MESNFQSRILLCAACNEEFVFTIEAQEYFVQKGLVDDPQMCKSCYTESKRTKRSQGADAKAQRAEAGNGRAGRGSERTNGISSGQRNGKNLK